MQEFSDENLKNIVRPIGTTLKDVIKLVGMYYTWKSDSPQFNIEKPTELHGGIIAQDVEQIFPDLVSSYKVGEEDFLKVDYTGLSMVFMESIKELNDMMNEQKSINSDFLTLFNKQKIFNQSIMANMALMNAAHLAQATAPAVYVNPTNISPNISNINPPK